jgi:hypothetical protein
VGASDELNEGNKITAAASAASAAAVDIDAVSLSDKEDSERMITTIVGTCLVQFSA